MCLMTTWLTHETYHHDGQDDLGPKPPRTVLIANWPICGFYRCHFYFLSLILSTTPKHTTYLVFCFLLLCLHNQDEMELQVYVSHQHTYWIKRNQNSIVKILLRHLRVCKNILGMVSVCVGTGNWVLALKSHDVPTQFTRLKDVLK